MFVRPVEAAPVEYGRAKAWPGRWSASLDALLCVAAVLGMALSLIPDFRQVQTLAYAATDFKTLYASAASLAAGGDPYDTRELLRIYRRDEVAPPATMYGRMPVYPPVTLLVVRPLTHWGMATAARVWFGVSLAAAALGFAMVLRLARACGLGILWRVGVLGLGAASPLLGFALDIGNVSLTVAGLCWTAWMLALRPLPGGWVGGRDRRDGGWSRAMLRGIAPGLALALALCLKPHTAAWVAAGLALGAGAEGRRVAAIGAGGFSLAGSISLALLAARGQLSAVSNSFATMLVNEHRTGSMSPGSRELLPLGGQITALQSLFGLGLGGWPGGLLAAGGVILLGWVLFRFVRTGQVRSWEADERVLFVSAVIAVGIIASYHRAHDGVVLTPLLLWISLVAQRLAGKGTTWRRSAAIVGVSALYVGEWFSIPARIALLLGQRLHARWIGELLMLRQGALFAALLACVLVMLVVRGRALRSF